MVWKEAGRTYDAVARTYEERFGDELAGKPFDRQLLDRFATAVGDPVVEVGSGPGQVGAHVRQRGRMVVGLDLSTEMARLASRRLDAGVVGDLRRLPVPSGALAGVLAFYSLIHVPRSGLGAALAELARVLRPDGRLLLAAHEGQDEVILDEFLDTPVPLAVSFFTLDELVAAATTAGLEVHDAQRRPPYPFEHPTNRLYLEAHKPPR